ncbi:MAG: hypothetical protein JO112_19395 [Planctomycetes bacterium]|nr:hypothetical protein [Planctomycetota bacterium]
MKRLVLLVEAAGDVLAVPSLVGKLLTELPQDLQGQLFLDNAPMKSAVSIRSPASDQMTCCAIWGTRPSVPNSGRHFWFSTVMLIVWKASPSAPSW